MGDPSELVAYRLGEVERVMADLVAEIRADRAEQARAIEGLRERVTRAESRADALADRVTLLTRAVWGAGAGLLGVAVKILLG